MADSNKFAALDTLFQFNVRRSMVYSGIGAAKCIPLFAEGLGGKRVVMFTDKGLVAAGIVDRMKEIFAASDSDAQLVGVFDDIRPDAAVSDILDCLSYFDKVGGDVLLGVGGGSVLDSVKMIKYLLCNKDLDIYDFFGDETLIMRKWPIARPLSIPHIAVTTAPGTGTEISTTSVVMNEHNGLKCALMDPYIGADIAVLDAEITASLPPRLTAETGMDAFTHAYEAFFSPKANCLSDAHATEAMRILMKYLPKCVQNGGDLEARQQVLLGNIMAISAFGLVKSRTPVHNLAVAMGNCYHVSHGLANALAIVPVTEYLPEIYTPRAEEFLRVIGVTDSFATPADAHRAAYEQLAALCTELGLPKKSDRMRLDEAGVKKMVDEVYQAPSARYYHIPPAVVEQVIRRVAYVE